MIEKSYSFAKQFRNSRTIGVGVFILSLAVGWNLLFSDRTAAQSISVAGPTSAIRVGEKLTYSISFGKIPNAGYAETHVVSRGKLDGKDAIEIRTKVKTLDLVSAAFLLFDDSRTVFVAPETGLPLYIRSNKNDSAIPKETVKNFLVTPSMNFDLVTLIFHARELGGNGTFLFFEGGQVHTATFQGSVSEKVRTEAGEFDTTVSTVTSDFLNSVGIKEAKVNFSADDSHLPVLIRLKTLKGPFRIALSTVVLPDLEVALPLPTQTASPRPTATSKPTPIPQSYVENQPISPELGFQVGEVLDYRVTNNGKPIGQVTLSARERKLFEKVDSLLLTFIVTGIEPGSTDLKLGDYVKVQVDPETLAPRRIESKFASSFVGLNQTVTFDPRSGRISYGGKTTAEAPIGTHSFLSLVYAMRSFNLKPSKNLANPVNDTRVAVFWESKSYVFTLRPSSPEEITINGEKVAAQQILIKTDNKELDALSLKVWLSADGRVPLRFSAGTYQADLILKASNLL